MRLGHAVAASACVPGVLEPLVLPDLFPDFTVRLVDGGVFDNQGTAALLDQNCTVVLVSDASGQMGDDKKSSESAVSVSFRTTSVLQARLRVAQSGDLADRRRGTSRNLLRPTGQLARKRQLILRRDLRVGERMEYRHSAAHG